MAGNGTSSQTLLSTTLGVEEPCLRISVIGGIRLSIANAVIPLQNRRGRALLGLLAIENGHVVSRERLAGLFWSDFEDRKARTSLRQTLHETREALEARHFRGLRIERADVSLASDSVELDVDLAIEAIKRGTDPDILTTAEGGADSILAGYEDLSPLFQDWLLAARRGVQLRLTRALEDSYNGTALPRSARRRLAEAALRLDTLNESACRTVMRLAAEDGEIGVALRAYAILYEALGTELDMEPSEATQTLVAEVKRGWLTPTTSNEMGVVVPEVTATSRPTTSSLRLGGAPVVAVLPFRQLGPDPPPPYLIDGILDGVVGLLSGLHEPVVISGNSTRSFRSSELDIVRIGEQLGAQYVATGVVWRERDRIRVSVELAEAASAAVLWSQAFETGGIDGFFDLQDRIAANIAHTLAPRVNEAELCLTSRRVPEELSAYHMLLRARDIIFDLGPEKLEAAGALLRQAVALDPKYAPVYATLADWYSLRVFQGWSPDPEADIRALEESARTALKLDPRNARALAILGHNWTISRRWYHEALGSFERALATAPNDAETWMWSSPTFAYLGDASEAIVRAERAISLSPHDPLLFRYQHFLSIAHYVAGNLEQAVGWGRRSMAANPNYTSNLRFTAASMAGMKQYNEVVPIVRKVMELQPDFRVSPMIARLPFRDEAARTLYGQRLIEAGLPY